jgi:hypothetical protein
MSPFRAGIAMRPGLFPSILGSSPSVFSRFHWTWLEGSPPPLKPRKWKSGKGLFDVIAEQGGSGWRGLIRLVKILWLLFKGKNSYWTKPKFKKQFEKCKP